MLTPPVYPDFEHAYLDVLGHLVDGSEYRNAPRGNAAREHIGLSFQIADPRARLPYLAERKVNPVWHFAEALWYIAGRNNVETLAYYAPHVRQFSRDGRTMGRLRVRLAHVQPGHGWRHVTVRPGPGAAAYGAGQQAGPAADLHGRRAGRGRQPRHVLRGRASSSRPGGPTPHGLLHAGQRLRPWAALRGRSAAGMSSCAHSLSAVRIRESAAV